MHHVDIMTHSKHYSDIFTKKRDTCSRNRPIAKNCGLGQHLTECLSKRQERTLSTQRHISLTSINVRSRADCVAHTTSRAQVEAFDRHEVSRRNLRMSLPWDRQVCTWNKSTSMATIWKEPLFHNPCNRISERNQDWVYLRSLRTKPVPPRRSTTLLVLPP